jgi:hypothetical protein
MPLPHNVTYVLYGSVVDPDTGYRKEIIIDHSTDKTAMQTKLTQLQSSGRLSDGSRVFNLVLRTNVLTVGQEGPPEE